MACIGGLKLAPPCSAFIGERRRRFDRSACLIDWGSHRQRLCAVSCGGGYGVGSVEKAVILQAETKESGDERRKGLSIGELDQWMKESVAEIVKNISEAPFLVQISSQAPNNSPSSPTSSVHIIIEKATSESWPFIKRRWNNSNLAPDAVVLVEELESKNGGTTKAWGLVVQGRGMNWPACYVLKTCQVKSCFGFSTHFCLAKSDFSLNYGLDFYFNKLWLQV